MNRSTLILVVLRWCCTRWNSNKNKVGIWKEKLLDGKCRLEWMKNELTKKLGFCVYRVSIEIRAEEESVPQLRVKSYVRFKQG